MSHRYKAKRRARYYRERGIIPDEHFEDLNTPCWCGEPDPHYEPQRRNCGGMGYWDCLCGGDFCICHNHGESECFGCVDCEQDRDEDDYDAHEEQWDPSPASLPGDLA